MGYGNNRKYTEKCFSIHDIFFQNGILVNSKKQYVIEPISTEEHHSRVKRENLHETEQGNLRFLTKTYRQCYQINLFSHMKKGKR